MDLNKTIQHYFRQPSLDSVSQSALEELVQQYPYVGSLQDLLLRKMKQNHAPEFNDQWRKAQLYFQDPYYLHSLLNRKPVTPAATGLVTELKSELADALARARSIAQATMNEEEPEPDESELEPVDDEELSDMPGLSDFKARTAPPEQAEAPAIDVEEDSDSPGTEQQAEQPVDKPEPAGRPLPGADALPFEKKSDKLAVDAGLRSDILSRESPIKIPSLRDLGPVTDDMPSFEPYHTIDYFASQGIKLSNEIPKDKFGKQLKSFTEWIRTMKKLPQTAIEEKLERASGGEKIEAMAAVSIEGKEILTETMAEVLIKQGHKERAAEIFRKLSLAHPNKSAYFASRIEQLNKVP